MKKKMLKHANNIQIKNIQLAMIREIQMVLTMSHQFKSKVIVDLAMRYDNNLKMASLSALEARIRIKSKNKYNPKLSLMGAIACSRYN